VEAEQAEWNRTGATRDAQGSYAASRLSSTGQSNYYNPIEVDVTPSPSIENALAIYQGASGLS
jgi:hypothetical protein